jgi:V-type H+-transporting ATPase subunit D
MQPAAIPYQPLSDRPLSLPRTYTFVKQSTTCLLQEYVLGCSIFSHTLTRVAQREAVFPTRQSLGLMKGKLKGAQTGHDLLKRKSEALTKRFREITRRIDDAKRKMGRVMQIAAFSLAEVSYAIGGAGIGYQIQESVRSAKFRVRTRQENVSGVFLPQFESFQTEGNNDFGLTGLGKGGQQVQRCRETYVRAVETLVELASLQTAFVILDDVIKVVNRRVNAMYACLLPTSTPKHAS